MTTFKYIERLERMMQLIKLQNTGNAKDFSRKIGISRRQLFYHLDELRTIGVPLKYSRNDGTYYLTEECDLQLQLIFNNK